VFGAHLSGIVLSAKDVIALAPIDGCPVACVKKIFEHAEVLLKAYVAITDLGIEKNPVTNLKRDGAERVKSAVKDACNQYKADWSKYGAIQ
jgi:uncharacterized metal-binding protein